MLEPSCGSHGRDMHTCPYFNEMALIFRSVWLPEVEECREIRKRAPAFIFNRTTDEDIVYEM